MDNPKAEHPHAKHRERTRNLVLQSGLDGFPDHNVLEFLLFYCIPKGDTNVTAHALIERFGSLQAVLDAPVEELVKVKGVGQYTATFLSILPKIAKRYYAEKAPSEVCLSDKEGLKKYLCAKFIGQTRECVYLLSFGSNGKLINCTDVGLGTATQIQLDVRSLLETAFRDNAVSVVLSHNHPNGLAAPSREDVDYTANVGGTFSRVNISLKDHIIVAGAECFSMRESSKYALLFS